MRQGHIITTKYFGRVFSVIKKEIDIIIFPCCPSSLNPVECKESRGKTNGNRSMSRRDDRELKKL